MPTAIWGESEPLSDDIYPLSLLKQLLAQMMERFSAQGACLALYDEQIRQIVIRLHLRAPSVPAGPALPNETGGDVEQIDTIPLLRRKTSGLTSSATPISSTGSFRRLTRPLYSLERLADSSPAALFPLGEAYSSGQGLIGITWRKGEPLFFRRDELAQPAENQPAGAAPSHPPYMAATVAQDGQSETLPSWYLSLPILGPPLPAGQSGQAHGQTGQKGQPAFQSLGVVVLYQYAPAPGFYQKQLEEAVQFAERIGLYIQNDSLRRAQTAMYGYIQRLQQISTTFPSHVILSRLVEEMYQLRAGRCTGIFCPAHPL